jgi:hypothetical protein
MLEEARFYFKKTCASWSATKALSLNALLIKKSRLAGVRLSEASSSCRNFCASK